jgi:hypothetical protein
MVAAKLVDEADLFANLANCINEADLYSPKFASFNKSDFELLLFTAYLDSLKVPARDYDISIDLGLTESRVRSLRERSQLRYPRELNWVEELSKSLSQSHYDQNSKQITVSFENPSVQNIIKNITEEEFGTVGYTLNRKHLVLPVEGFLLLAVHAEEDKEKTLEKLNKVLKSELSEEAKIEKGNLGNRFLGNVQDVASVVDSLSPVFSLGAPLVQSLRILVGL